MAVDKPLQVKRKEITSNDIMGFSGGLFLEQGGKGNQLEGTRRIKLTRKGFITKSDSLQSFLPNTVGTVYQVKPTLISGELYYFTADDGKIKYCQEGDDTWSDCGGDNTITTGNGVKNVFLRVLDSLLIMNGTDRLAYVNLSDKTVVKYTKVDDPTGAPTAVVTGLTGTTFKIYYGYSFSGAVGETKLSPILTQDISIERDRWDGTTQYVTISRPAGNPTGAKNWNLYIAIASNGGVIQDSDMLRVATGLDLNTLSIVDNGTLPIDLALGTPPDENSTEGMKASYGIETDGRPVLYGDTENPYNIWIGGDGDYAMDFSSSHGGFLTTPSKGTDYFPSNVIGFRNGQGIPSLTVLFSNTEGLSKQAILEQQTVNYGNQSFVVWGVTEQNYGSAGVSSAYGVINYKGALSFPTTDGFMSMDTQPTLQNVLSSTRITDNIYPYVSSIKTDSMKNIIGAAWNNKLIWIVPSYGFTTPNQIIVRDLDNDGAWYVLDIPSQWIGVVSPNDSAAFVYVCQGNKILKLTELFGTVDYVGGIADTFSTGARGCWVGVNEANNSYKAVVQAVFDVRELIGDITVGVNYIDENGRLQTKQKTYSGPKYIKSFAGGWADPGYTYSGTDLVPSWNDFPIIDESASTSSKEDKRIVLPMENVIVSRLQWWIQTPDDYGSYIFRGVSYEGINLGITPDLG